MTRPRVKPSRAWDACVRVLLAAAGTLLLLLGTGRAQAEFDHETSFSRLAADNFSSRSDLYYRSTRWYLDNYDFAKYSGYQDLLKKFKRYLPTGQGLTVLQAESSHTPDAIGEVTHLFDYEASDTHSEQVAGFSARPQRVAICIRDTIRSRSIWTAFIRQTSWTCWVSSRT